MDVLESWIEGSGLSVSLGLGLEHNSLEALTWHQAGYPWGRELEFQHRLGLLGRTRTGISRGQHGPAGSALGSAWQKVGLEEVHGAGQWGLTWFSHEGYSTQQEENQNQPSSEALLPQGDTPRTNSDQPRCPCCL